MRLRSRFCLVIGQMIPPLRGAPLAVLGTKLVTIAGRANSKFAFYHTCLLTDNLTKLKRNGCGRVEIDFWNRIFVLKKVSQLARPEYSAKIKSVERMRIVLQSIYGEPY